jgi:hypothetical protein
LWNGDEGFGVERWLFWKQRLRVVGGLRRRWFAGRMVDAVVGCAGQAVEAMRDVEQGYWSAVDGMSGLFERDNVSSLVW